METNYKILENYASEQFEKSGLSQIGGWDFHRIENMKYAINIHNSDYSKEFECWSKGQIYSAINSIIKEKIENKEIIEYEKNQEFFEMILDENNPNDNWGKSSYATIDGIKYYHPFYYGNQVEKHKFAYQL